MPVMLKVREVAELCGVSTRTITRMVDAGKMPSPVRLGGAVRWNREELEAWIASGCRDVSSTVEKNKTL